jgi:hypothetical protein
MKDTGTKNIHTMKRETEFFHTLIATLKNKKTNIGMVVIVFKSILKKIFY